jgi:hypothetical protein
MEGLLNVADGADGAYGANEGGGGGGVESDDDGRDPNALTAAIMAADPAGLDGGGAWLYLNGSYSSSSTGFLEWLPFVNDILPGGGTGGGGGGGAAALDGGGGRGAVEGGGGGGAGRAGLEDLGNGGGAGLAEEGSGGGAGGGRILLFLKPGGGGGGFPSARAAVDGLDAGFGGTFLRFTKGLGIAGDDSVCTGPELGLRPFVLGNDGVEAEGNDGGRGAAAAGGRGANGLEVSESEYENSPPAPVITPPLLFFNFGIPPANMPPSCGAVSPPPEPLVPPPVSLFARARFPPPGTGGARPPGAFMPGIGGAPAIGGGPEFEVPLLSTMGADLSLTWATFFNRAVAGPFDMSDSSAP